MAPSPPVSPNPRHAPAPLLVGRQEAAPARARSPGEWADLAGMLLSLLCAVHCAATVLLVSVLTTLGVAGVADPRVERVMLAAAIGVGGVVLGHGALVHRRRLPLLPFVLGVTALVGVRPRLPEESPLELVTVVIGALGIVGGHALSYRRQRGCAVPQAPLRP